MQLFDHPQSQASLSVDHATPSRWHHPLSEAIENTRSFHESSDSRSQRRNQQFYTQTNLVTDDQSVVTASFTDPALVNPWGVAFSATGPFWISDAGTGLSTLYNGVGLPQALIVAIPTAPNSPVGTIAAPTGQVFNATPNFKISSTGPSLTGNPAAFIFATEDGTISAWSASINRTQAILAIDNSSTGAVYKGLALAGDFLYAANFHDSTIDVFDKEFNAVGSFTDPSAPEGFAPFNIQNLNGTLYVTFAKQQGPDNRDDEAGRGNGFIDVFNPQAVADPTTHGFSRFASGTAAGGQITSLNSPWGLALAPSNFGKFSNDLLVGNFGNGLIDAFNPDTGRFEGILRDAQGKPIQIDGLWALTFGNGGAAGQPNELFFTAGIEDEQHGLFGKLEAQTAATV